MVEIIFKRWSLWLKLEILEKVGIYKEYLDICGVGPVQENPLVTPICLFVEDLSFCTISRRLGRSGVSRKAVKGAKKATRKPAKKAPAKKARSPDRKKAKV